MPPTFTEVLGSYSGFLTDRQLRLALAQGFLLEDGTWDAGQIRHASYTIRLGQRVEIERSGAGSEKREHRVITLTNGGGPLQLRPGEIAKLYSLENLRLPASVLGFTVARGLLVVESLVPENTYVDPGFSGQIYTTVTNLSGRVLSIPYGSSIARLFLYRLPEDVEHPYRSGPAIGIAQHLESVSAVAFPLPATAKVARLADLLQDLVATERGGARDAELFRRNAVLGRLALLTAVVWPIAVVAGIEWTWLRTSLGSFVANVTAGLVSAALIFGVERLWRRLGGVG